MAKAGWYRDKANPSQLRYWDGENWTGERRDAPVTAAPTTVAIAAGSSERMAWEREPAPVEQVTQVDVEEPVDEVPVTKQEAKPGLGKKDIQYILLGIGCGSLVGLPIAYVVYTYFSAS